MSAARGSESREKARRWRRIENYLLAVAIMASFTGLAFVCGAIFGPMPDKPVATPAVEEVRHFQDDVEVIAQ